MQLRSGRQGVWCSAALLWAGAGVACAAWWWHGRRRDGKRRKEERALTRSHRKWRKLAVMISDAHKEGAQESVRSLKARIDLSSSEGDQLLVNAVSFFGAPESQRDRYRCVMLAPFDLLYAAPLNAGRVLQIDPVTEVAREIGPDIQGLQKYVGMTAAGNGLLYAAPFSAGRVLEIDPVTELARELGPKLPGLAKYAALAVAAGGALVAAPLNAARALRVNAATGVVEEIGAELPGRKKYYCMAATPDGLVYAAPFNASKVLQINPATDAVQEIGPTLPGVKKYYCMAAGRNGMLYAVPFHARRVLQIDPMTGVVQEIGADIAGDKKYHAVACAPSGVLYAAPFDAGQVLRIDPDTGDVRHIGPEIRGSEKYGAMAVAPNGSLYAAPWNAGRALQIDPNTDEVTQIGPDIDGLQKYGCLAAASNGNLFAAPCNARQALRIDLFGNDPKHSGAEAHSESPCKHNASLLDQGRYSDVSIAVGERTFAAHRAILARIPFFRAAFDHDLDEQGHGTIEVKGTSELAFEHVLQVIYTGQTSFIADMAEVSLLKDLLELAERFELCRMKVHVAHRLTELMSEVSGLSAEMVGQHLRFARLYGLPSIQRLCIAYARQHAADVMMSPETHGMFDSDPGTFEELVYACTGKRRQSSGVFFW